MTKALPSGRADPCKCRSIIRRAESFHSFDRPLFEERESVVKKNKRYRFGIKHEKEEEREAITGSDIKHWPTDFMVDSNQHMIKIFRWPSSSSSSSSSVFVVVVVL